MTHDFSLHGIRIMSSPMMDRTMMSRTVQLCLDRIDYFEVTWNQTATLTSVAPSPPSSQVKGITTDPPRMTTQ